MRPVPPAAWSRRGWLAGRERVPALSRLGEVLNVVGAVWIAALMALICADVAARGLFGTPLPRVPEIVGYSIAAIVFLQLPNTLDLKRLTRADAFIDALMIARPVAGSVFNAAYCLAGAAVMGLIAWGLIPDAWETWEYDEYFGQVGELIVPVWPFRATMAVCAVVTAAVFLVQVWDYAAKALADEPDHPDARRGRPRGWGAVAALAVFLGGAALWLGPHLDPLTVAFALVGGMLVLILAGMQIGVALILLSFLGAWFIRGDVESAVNLLRIASAGAIQDQLFGVVPLFVLMGMLVNLGNVGRDTFDVCQWILGRVAGGLGVATVVANAIFAAITGVSIASAVVFTRVSVPPMVEHGYTPKFAVGIVAGSSVLGMLIPPSLLLIVFGVLAEVSVGQLFTAAVAPGILLAAAFCVMIVLVSILMPDFAGRLHDPDPSDAPTGWTRKPPHAETPSSALRKMLPIAVLILAVLGGIYGGFFTPTEAGAVGAFFALLIVLVKAAFEPGLVTRAKLYKALIDTGHVSVSILFLIIAANMYTRMIALSGLPNEVVGLMTEAELGFYGLIFLYLAMVLVMGMVLDSVSIMLITLPLILPALAAFGTDLVWFGIVTVVAVEIGLLTPPLGLTVYVVKAALGNTQVKLGEIFAGSFPFVVVMTLVTLLLVAFPGLTHLTR